MKNHVAVALSALLFLLALPAVAQNTQSDDLKTAIDSLNETQKAILKELQDIKRVLAIQQAPRAAADALPAAPMDIAMEPFKGAANARVAIIEFSEFQCPFCARYGKDAYPQILKEYVDTGKIKYVWRDYPLGFHQNAQKAAEAAHCAGEQGKFWEMHDRLFENPKNIAPVDLPKHAEALQLNSSAFQRCLDSGRFAGDIKKDMVVATTAGVTGTPTFLIGTVQPDGTVKVTKKLVGAKPFAEFKAAIDSLLTPSPAGMN